jgi:Tol biopolymer transport system component
MSRKVFLLVIVLLVSASSLFCAAGTMLPESNSAPQDSEAPSDATGQFTVPHLERWGIYKLEVESGEVELIYTSPARISYLRWSPRGDEFVFSQPVDGNANEQEEIFTLNLDGGGLNRLTENSFWDLYPAWSSDGTKIAFLSWRTQSLGIYVMGSNGEDTTLLVDTPDQEADVDWRDDLVVLTRASRIWSIHPDGSSIRALTDPPKAGEWGAANLPFGDYDPRISPDGTKVVYERLVGDGTPYGEYDFFSLNLGTMEEIRLTTTGFSQGLASWSHTGEQLVYIVSAIGDTGKYDIYIMNADGTDSHNVTPGYFPAQFLCHWAVFANDDNDIYFIGEWWE